MDELILFLERNTDQDIEVKELAKHLEAAFNSPDNELFDPDSFKNTMSYLGQISTMSYDDAMQLLNIIVPGLDKTQKSLTRTQTNIDNAVAPSVNIIDEVDNETRAVPEQNFRSNVRNTSLNSFSRKRTSPIRTNHTSSSGEGSRLRSRNIAGMTNEQYDTMANSIQPKLVNDIASYATQAGIGPVYTSKTATTEQAYRDRPSVSDPEQSGFSTPHVSRKAIRQRIHAVKTSPPTAGGYDDPISPDSSFREPISPSREVLSPTRFAEMDDGSRKYIQEVLAKKSELQKMVTEKERRIELIESQYEKRTVSLERELDECKAELTMKKRDIERLKASEKSYLENLQIAESEVDRLGVSLSNATSQSADLRRQLDKKSAQMTDANRRALDSQAEISKLRSSLESNQQQQDQLLKEHRHLELRYQELEHEFKAAREFKDEAEAAQQKNMQLSYTIEQLNQEIKDLRLQQQQQQAASSADQDSAADAQKRASRKYKSLQDELAQLDDNPDLGIDDLITGDDNALASYRTRAPGASESAATKVSDIGATSTDAQELKDMAVRQWISTALGRCSSEDLIILNEVWKRIKYCDTSAESQDDLRRELIEVFMAPYKYGLKEAIRSRSNATLSRIVDNVAGEYMGILTGDHSRHGKGASALAQVMANGQHTTAAIVLYSVVIFCLGIITASYFNLAQPLSASVPFGMVNGTGSVIHDGGDGSMSMMRQILVVDDTPVNKYYTPLRKRSPRSRLGEILFYWMETLLWDDADTPIPT
ncbi:hypothetical protein IWW36_002290 [Coemansia brasiliensis]|uniref:Uncharacterized protein n=1 Tax=Coemansia brasiliensis TaxID=2650707 RepID=A0A9W8IDQ0_9FUNG|nr:hypothetical protein IWW36_002290 [Coemansia brasiliensis]